LELERNPALASPSLEVFRSIHLSARAPIPDYYRHMAPINRAGPTVYGTPPVPLELDPAGLRALMEQQVPVVDIRTRLDFATAHIPAALDIEDSGSLLAYASWLLPFNSPLALVSYDRQQAERITADLFRIGYESVNGFLNFARWTEAGGATASLPIVDVATAKSILQRGLSPVADVRFSYEQDALPLPGAAMLPMERFSEWSATLGKGPVLIVCASGQRAAMMASALRVRGVEASALATGGAADLV
jgi:rhodanese-related sulfurtransferase